MLNSAVSTICNSTKKLLLAGIALSALIPISSAMAADVPVNKPAADAQSYNWTGCYVGANAGGAASGSDLTSSLNPGTHLSDPGDLAAVGRAGTGSANDNGLIGGGQVGCNWQTEKYVFGIEGDLDYFSAKPFLSVSGTLTTGDTFTIANSVKTNWLGTVRPRAGIAAGRSLIYVTGGVAFANFSYAQTYTDTLFAAAGSSAASGTAIGWTVGAGWETAWTDNWTVKFEYFFAKFPSIGALGGVVASDGGTNALHGSADLAMQIARVGLNYKF